MDEHERQETILRHLVEVAAAKRALLEVAEVVRSDYPVQASLLLITIRSLTRSADRLLGDTAVTEIPS